MKNKFFIVTCYNSGWIQIGLSNMLPFLYVRFGSCLGSPWCIGQPRKALWEPNITFQEEALYMRELSHEGRVLFCTH